MKVVFLCGSLEPGRDGVGDYTRTVCQELQVLGCETAICALNDRFQLVDAGVCEMAGGTTELRLPSAIGWSVKRSSVRNWLQNQHPDVISLQYVPYSFNSRGLPFGLDRWLGSVAPASSSWHVMFHETWIGITRRSPWRHRLVGAIQRWIGQKIVHRLRPRMCHTSNVLYTELLADVGIDARRLPLCSTVPKTCAERKWMEAELASLGIPAGHSLDWWIAGMFGTCYPDFPLERQIAEVVEAAARTGRRLAVLGAGGGGLSAHVWEKRVTAAAPQAVVRHFSRLTDAKASAFLSVLHHGIPATPRQFLGKSASAAAMHAHGVSLDGSYEVDMPEYKDRWMGGVATGDLFWEPARVARQMMTDLHAYS